MCSCMYLCKRELHFKLYKGKILNFQFFDLYNSRLLVFFFFFLIILLKKGKENDFHSTGTLKEFSQITAAYSHFL